MSNGTGDENLTTHQMEHAIKRGQFEAWRPGGLLERAVIALETLASLATFLTARARAEARINDERFAEYDARRAREAEGAKPVEGAPVEGAPVEAKPVEAKPVEAKPVEGTK